MRRMPPTRRPSVRSSPRRRHRPTERLSLPAHDTAYETDWNRRIPETLRTAHHNRKHRLDEAVDV
ncbi:hypothetical protein BN12_380028 [Nostocoides japonicum T1-X7]|uniref:Uncharacterized protein n=1 Tax=Nostocoides japonicum T1-X7 TaxID=1194083 RepID=A0A077LZ75_9MICO|nr:hypothetical protein BN12_380028 [Tetrasphaera japonica T1-X7]